ncbi:MAG TPA: class I SAM-dependent methyltransferase [Myxococcus sp.]|nr:class I SAM-dependent methyltransferase [Myxococcus sp.]
MRITMSPQDYATAFRLLAMTARHHENIGQVVEQRVLPRLPERRSLLDVGSGPGIVSRRLAPHFSSLTLLEPNKEQLEGFDLPGARLINGTLESYSTSAQYDVVLCSHVLYHMPVARWGESVDRLLSLTRPGGFAIVVLGSLGGHNYELHRDFTDNVITSSNLIEQLRAKGLQHETVPTLNSFSATTFDEMYTLCCFFVLEDCYTREQLAAMSGDEVARLDELICKHVEQCREADGVYRLTQGDDVILIPKP